MSRPVKVFKVHQGPVAEAIHFEIEIAPRDGGDPVIHEFEAYGEPPPGATLRLASMVRFDHRGAQRMDLNALAPYFELVMPPVQYARFMALLEDAETLVPMETVMDVFTHLHETYSDDRPTPPSPTSSNGRRETGPSSTAELPSGASTS